MAFVSASYPHNHWFMCLYENTKKLYRRERRCISAFFDVFSLKWFCSKGPPIYCRLIINFYRKYIAAG